jgi:hypothetical protein
MSRSDGTAHVVPVAVRLIESGLQLMRAEAALAALQARHLAVRSVAALIATVVAASFVQLTLLLLVLTPLLLGFVPVRNLVLSIGASAVLGLGTAFGSLIAWRGVNTPLTPPRDAGGGVSEARAPRLETLAER